MCTMSTIRSHAASHIGNVQTPAEELRATLSRLEAAVGQLGFSGQEHPTEILHLMDRATELVDVLSRHGGNMTSERARFDTITNQLRRKRQALLKQLGGTMTLRALRDEVQTTPQGWWWTIDEELERERKLRTRRTVWTVGVVVAITALLSVLYTQFLAPDEATRARYRHEQRAESALTQDNLEAALSEVELALTHAPGDEKLLVLRSVVLDLLGRSAEAERDFALARQRSSDLEALYSTRAQAYLLAEAADRALDDAQRMIDLNPASAMGYYQMGNANANLGNLLEASENFETAGTLAAAAGRTELEGMARIQLANVTMLLSAPQLPTATPLP